MAYAAPQATSRRRGLVAAGILLGLGLSGFADGILFHQVLGWHHMVSSVNPDATLNRTLDGLFHVATYLLVVAGLALLWRARSELRAFTGRRFLGAILLGAGLFDVVEGLVNHQLLGLHHVHPQGNVLAWDLAFLAFGALLAVTGALLLRRPRAAPEARARGARGLTGP